MFLFQTHPAALTRRGFRDFRAFASGKVVALFLCAGFACAGRGASASTFRINITATNLTANSPYGLSFLLQNGGTDNDLRAVISNFSLTGAAFTGDGSSSIGSNPVVGSLASGLALASIDAGGFSDYLQQFVSTTGSAAMSFTLNLSSAAPQVDADDPDYFRFALLDNTSTPIRTGGPPDNGSLVYAAFDSTSPSVQTFSTNSQSGPQVTAQIQPSAAPEPGTFALLLPSGAGAAAAALLHYRRKRIPARA